MKEAAQCKASKQRTKAGSKMEQAYEVLNPSFSDMNIEQQIEAGINDWCADGRMGPYYGQTKEQAERMRQQYEG